MIYQADFLVDLTRRIFRPWANATEAEVVCARERQSIRPRFPWRNSNPNISNGFRKIKLGSIKRSTSKPTMGRWSSSTVSLDLANRSTASHGIGCRPCPRIWGGVIALKDSAHLGRIGDWPEMCARPEWFRALCKHQ